MIRMGQNKLVGKYRINRERVLVISSIVNCKGIYIFRRKKVYVSEGCLWMISVLYGEYRYSRNMPSDHLVQEGSPLLGKVLSRTSLIFPYQNH